LPQIALGHAEARGKRRFLGQPRGEVEFRRHSCAKRRCSCVSCTNLVLFQGYGLEQPVAVVDIKHGGIETKAIEERRFQTQFVVPGGFGPVPAGIRIALDIELFDQIAGLESARNRCR